MRERVQSVPLTQVHACSFQPRKDFSEEALRELADSIKAQGIVQPLIVRAKGGGFELIAGERRWRAAQLLGLPDVPVIVREADDRAVLELALIENLQRENLNPLEEALGYSQLMAEFRLTQEEISAKIGKSRATVANALRLLKLPQEVQQQVRSGKLSVGHAKVILGLGTEADQRAAAARALAQSLSVRQTEEMVSHWQAAKPAASSSRAASPPPARDAHVADIENQLKQRLGTKVSLRYRQGKGALDIRFFSDDELQRILDLLGIRVD